METLCSTAAKHGWRVELGIAAPEGEALHGTWVLRTSRLEGDRRHVLYAETVGDVDVVEPLAAALLDMLASEGWV